MELSNRLDHEARNRDPHGDLHVERRDCECVCAVHGSVKHVTNRATTPPLNLLSEDSSCPESEGGRAAREKVEAAVQEIHSHTGVYLATELSL